MFKRIREFLREVQIEIKKVVFPTKRDLISATWAVIVSTIIMAIFLGIVDSILIRFVKYILR